MHGSYICLVCVGLCCVSKNMFVVVEVCECEYVCAYLIVVQPPLGVGSLTTN